MYHPNLCINDANWSNSESVYFEDIDETFLARPYHDLKLEKTTTH